MNCRSRGALQAAPFLEILSTDAHVAHIGGVTPFPTATSLARLPALSPDHDARSH